MKQQFSIPAIVVALVIVFMTSFAGAPGCASDGPAAPSGNCGPGITVRKQAVVTMDQPSFFHTSGTGIDSCDAHYQFYFRWANDIKRAIDNDMPPLKDLAQAFQFNPAYYFGHTPPTFIGDQVVEDTLGRAIPGKGWWVIDFSEGAGGTSDHTAHYYVSTGLDLTQAGSADSVQIVSFITYYSPH